MMFEEPKFIVTQVVVYKGRETTVVAREGQYDPGSVCWTYLVGGEPGWVLESQLEAA